MSSMVGKEKDPTSWVVVTSGEVQTIKSRLDSNFEDNASRAESSERLQNQCFYEF
jgi:hypothetical protein